MWDRFWNGMDELVLDHPVLAGLALLVLVAGVTFAGAALLALFITF